MQPRWQPLGLRGTDKLILCLSGVPPPPPHAYTACRALLRETAKSNRPVRRLPVNQKAQPGERCIKFSQQAQSKMGWLFLGERPQIRQMGGEHLQYCWVKAFLPRGPGLTHSTCSVQSQNNDLNSRRTNDLPAPPTPMLSAAHLHVYKYQWIENTSSCIIPSHLYLLEHCYYSTGRLKPRGLNDFLKAKVNSRTESRLQASQLPVIKIIAAITERCNHGSGTVPDALRALLHLLVA